MVIRFVYELIFGLSFFMFFSSRVEASSLSGLERPTSRIQILFSLISFLSYSADEKIVCSESVSVFVLL